jgi:hypothetical protein
MLNKEQSWNLFYDNAKDEFNAEEVWKNVIGACYMKNIALYRSWKTYVRTIQTSLDYGLSITLLIPSL